MIADNAPDPTTGTKVRGDLASQVFDSLIDSIAVIDRHGVIRATNLAWQKFAINNGSSTANTGVGVNYLEVCQSTTDSDLGLATKAQRGIERVLQGTSEVFRLEYPCHSPTEMRWFLLTVSPLKGDPHYAVVAHTPITERKLMEMRLIESERLAAIGQAMRGLSHEGRNTLQSAQSCIDLLRCHVELDPEALELISKVDNAQHRLIGLYEEVRSYASPITLNRSPYPLNQLVQQVWESYKQRHSQYRFRHSTSALNLTIAIDVTAVEQVLRSLFDNAISVETRSTMLEVSYIAAQIGGTTAVTLVVSDDGTGIPAELHDKVFEPFFTTKLRGTGLGLTTSRRIVEAHGGWIEIGDPRLGGASVYVTLPVSLPGRQDTSFVAGATV